MTTQIEEVAADLISYFVNEPEESIMREFARSPEVMAAAARGCATSSTRPTPCGKTRSRGCWA